MFKIFLVLDPNRGLQLTPLVLEQYGYEVFRCRLNTSGTDEAVNSEVIQWIEQKQPDLIIVENFSFFAAIPQLKSNPKTQSVPVLIHTIFANEEWLKPLNFDDYCKARNFNAVELINKIEIFLKQKPTTELILELLQANPQGLTLKEIKHQIDRGFLKRNLDALIESGVTKTKEQEGELVYCPVQR